MKILSVECSAGPASAAVIEDGRIAASSFVNIRLTHSQTLLPMIAEALAHSGNTVGSIDGIAVAAGPGSFTGIRIGISAVKGLAAPRGLPCAAVSTLRAMAEGFRDTDCLVCAVMDARCGQVYNALFTVKNGEISRLCADRALMAKELAPEVERLAAESGLPVFVTGDGTDLFFPFLSACPAARKASGLRRYQNAVCVGLAAAEDFSAGRTVTPEKLLPVYLRLPQAERELRKKQETKGNA